MLKLLVFTSWEQRGGGGQGKAGATPALPAPPSPGRACHLGVRQDDLRDAADDGDEIKDVPGVPEIILWEEGEREGGFEIGVASLKGAGTWEKPSFPAQSSWEVHMDPFPGCSGTRMPGLLVATGGNNSPH